MKRDWQSVEMPPGIARRPRDARGFPITFVTLIQSDGRPDFTTIDGRQILRCVREQLCGMCGEALAGPLAFIGGPLSIDNRNFLDPPMHVACAKYAMQVCPHIAIPTSRYGKPKEGEGRELYERVHPDRPEKFGLYITRLCRVASVDGQPIFFAGEPEQLVWQDQAPWRSAVSKFDPADTERGKHELEAEAEEAAQEELIAVTLLIDNFYEDGEKIKTTVESWIPAPPPESDEAAYEDWTYDHIFEHTGTGKTEGDSAYFVTVASSSRPDLLPVGTEYEFGT